MKAFYLFCTIGLCFNVYAGNGTSGGGGAFVCRDLNNNITSTYLLDLWEAEKINNLDILFSNESPEDQVHHAIDKLNKIDSYLAAETEKQVELIFNSARNLPDDITLPAPTDANSRYQKKNCPLEGMMFYDGDLDQLQVVPSVFSKLASNTDIAAAKLHEALYYVFRNNLIPNVQSQISTSIPIRNLIGCLFSKSEDCLISKYSKNDLLTNSDSTYFCESKNFAFYLLKVNPYIESSFKSSDFPGVTSNWVALLDKYLELEVSNLTFFNPGKPGLVQGYAPNTMSKFQYNYIPFFFENNATNISDSRTKFKDNAPELSKFSPFLTFPRNDSQLENPECRKIK